MPRPRLLALGASVGLLLLLLLRQPLSIDAAGTGFKTRRNKTSRAQMRKTQQGALPETKLTHLQNRGVRRKDTPAQQNSQRDLGALSVPTEQGQVKGFIPQYEVQPTNDWYGVRAWLGLAYAAPPVGQLRFAPPHPPSPYGALYKAQAEKPRCPQFAFQSVFTDEVRDYDGDGDVRPHTQKEEIAQPPHTYINTSTPTLGLPLPRRVGAPHQAGPGHLSQRLPRDCQPAWRGVHAVVEQVRRHTLRQEGYW